MPRSLPHRPLARRHALALPLALAAVALLPLAPARAQAPRQAGVPAAATRTEAVARLRAGYFAQDFAGSAAAGAALRERFATDPELRAWHAVNLARAERVDEALALADSIRRAAPASPWGPFARAFVLGWEDGRSKEALTLARRVRRAMPASRDAVWLHGFLLHRAGEYKAVVALADSTARRMTSWAELYVLKGNALASLGEDSTAPGRAVAAFSEARRLDPANVNAHFLPAANLARELGDSTAYALMRRALELSPRSASIRSRYWERLKATRTLTAAQKDSVLSAEVARLLAERADDPAAHYQAVEAYNAFGRWTDLWQAEERLLAAFPTGVEAERVLYLRIAALRDSVFKQMVDDTARANAEARRLRAAFVARPAHQDRSLLSGALIEYVLDVQRDSTVSADSLRALDERLLAINKANPHRTHLELPMAVAERGKHFRWAEALVLAGDSLRRKDVERLKDFYARQKNVGEYANALDYQKGATHDALGWIYLHEGRLADATRELGKARALLKNSPQLFYHLGRLAEAKGDSAEAQRMYARGYPLEGRMTGLRNTEALRRVYAARTGSMDGFDAYVARLREEDLARRRKEIAAKRLTAGGRVPAFALARFGGDSAKLTEKDLEGKIVVMNFWGVWCGPCVYETPQIQKFHEAVKGDSTVVFLTVDYNDELETLRGYMSKRKHDFPVLLDAGGWVSKTAKINAFPTTWFVGRDGKLAFVHVGSSDGVYDEFMMRVELLRAEGR